MEGTQDLIRDAARQENFIINFRSDKINLVMMMKYELGDELI